MPQARKKNDGAADNGRPKARLGSLDHPSGDYMVRRTRAFQDALWRKGLPMVWGTGILRTDEAWKRDQEYLREEEGE